MDMHDDDDLSALVRGHASRFAAPPELAARVTAALAAESAITTAAAPARRIALPRRRWLEGVMLFMAGAAAAGVATVLLRPSAGVDEEEVAGWVADGHVRSLMADHLVDVESTDRHTVKPWFAGRLDFSPPVIDMADAGDALVGGRLDYLGRHPAAALVYRQRKHVINLFVWADAAGADAAPAALSRQGFHLVRWHEQGMQFWAVSDLNEPELRGFAERLRERIAAPAPG